jgi:hypothetical protein
LSAGSRRKKSPSTSRWNSARRKRWPREPTPPRRPPEKPARKPRKKAEASAEGSEKKLSGLDAAAKVLAEANEPLSTKQMVEAMAAKGYWTSPGGKTPAATLYSAILREIQTKEAESRSVKTDRGRFALAAK